MFIKADIGMIEHVMNLLSGFVSDATWCTPDDLTFSDPNQTKMREDTPEKSRNGIRIAPGLSSKESLFAPLRK